MSHIDPDPAGWEQFKSLPRDTPIHMLNLVRLKDKAEYPDGHPNAGKGLSGLDAYRAYGEDSGPVFRKVGGEVIWSGRPEAMVIGPQAEQWHLAFIAAYPNADAFLAMISDPEYKNAVQHRTAGVEDSRLVRMAPQTAGKGFG